MLRRTMRCSFCGRPDSEVAKLVAGPSRLITRRVYICDACAAETIRIMDAHAGDDRPRRETRSVWHRAFTRLRWPRRGHGSNRVECHAT